MRRLVVVVAMITGSFLSATKAAWADPIVVTGSSRLIILNCVLIATDGGVYSVDPSTGEVRIEEPPGDPAYEVAFDDEGCRT